MQYLNTAYRKIKIFLVDVGETQSSNIFYFYLFFSNTSRYFFGTFIILFRYISSVKIYFSGKAERESLHFFPID